ncbi:hypothetical protein [Galactobacter valiniphilus]|uniref:hypothetical protein n=1 Tax=Galactobacter valiniphilus TaxID=2676122 RepID=UPI003735022B
MTLPPSPQDPGTPNNGAPWPQQAPGTPPAAPWPGATQPPATPAAPAQPGQPGQPGYPGQPGSQPGFAPAQPAGVVPPDFPGGAAAYPAAPGYTPAPVQPAGFGAQPGQAVPSPAAQPPVGYPGAPVVAAGGPSGGASLPWWISGIPKQAWLRAALLGGLALGAGLLASLVTVLLSLQQATSALNGISRVGLSDDVTGQWFPATIQLWGMGYLGVLGGGMESSASILSLSGRVSFFFLPLVVPLASWAVLRWLAPRLGTAVTAPHWAPRAVLGAATGLGAAVIVTVLTALIPLASQDSSSQLTLRSASFLGFLGVWAIVGTLVYFSLRPRGSGPWGQLARDASATALWHLWTLGLLLGVIATIYLCVKAESAEPLLTLPLVLPFLGTMLFQMGYFIPFSMGGSATVGLSASAGTSFSLFSEGVPGWVWPIVVLLGLVWLVLASVRWRVRRGMPGSNPLEWAALPAVYLVLGLALLIVDRLGFGMSLGERAGGSGSIGPAGWGFLVLALVGLAIEALSRYVAIPLLRAMPAGLRGFLSAGLPSTPSVPLPQAAPKAAAPQGWGAGPATAPAPAPGFPAPSGYPGPGAAQPAAPGYVPAPPAAPAPGSAPAAGQAAPAAFSPAPAAPAAPAQPAGPWDAAPPQPWTQAPSEQAAPQVPIQDPGHPPIAAVPAPEDEASLRLAPPAPAPDAAWAPQAPPAAPAEPLAPAVQAPATAPAEPSAPAEPPAVVQEEAAEPASPETAAEPCQAEDTSAPGSAPLGGWTRPPREPGSGPRH